MPDWMCKYPSGSGRSFAHCQSSWLEVRLRRRLGELHLGSVRPDITRIPELVLVQQQGLTLRRVCVAWFHWAVGGPAESTPREECRSEEKDRGMLAELRRSNRNQ